MSYKERLSDINRDGPVSLTQQIVDVFSGAIEAGDLGPGDRLPPTREVAERAGVNHLTAARAYRKLADLGLVTSRVGSGTFVRTAAAAAGVAAPRSGSADPGWQHYALPEETEMHSDRVVTDMLIQADQADAADLLPLSVGYPASSLYPVDRIAELTAEVLAEDAGEALQYTAIEGPLALRTALAEHMARRGAAEDPDAIISTTGARQALALVARAILRPGDVAACESPSFFGVIDSIHTAGARILPVPIDDDGIDTDALEALLRRHEIRMLAVQPRLNNPTGRDLSPERREHLIELARRHGFFILEDAIYGDIRFEGETLTPLRAEAPDHVVYVDSLTKTVGGGLRLGWVAASGPVLERIARQKRLDDTHSVTLTQLVGARFLASGDHERHLAERAIPFYRERRDALLEALGTELSPVASWVHPRGGGHLFLTLHEPLDDRELLDEAIRQGVAYVPGAAILPERPRATHMRLSFGFLEPSEIREAVRRLGTAIRAVRRARRPSAAPRSLPVA
jgi:DNA-binding transcriptional MocR family regulator